MAARPRWESRTLWDGEAGEGAAAALLAGLPAPGGAARPHLGGEGRQLLGGGDRGRGPRGEGGGGGVGPGGRARGGWPGGASRHGGSPGGVSRRWRHQRASSSSADTLMIAAVGIQASASAVFCKDEIQSPASP